MNLSIDVIHDSADALPSSAPSERFYDFYPRMGDGEHNKTLFVVYYKDNVRTSGEDVT